MCCGQVAGQVVIVEADGRSGGRDGRGSAGAEARAVDNAHAGCGRQLAERVLEGHGVSIIVVIVVFANRRRCWQRQ